MNISKHALTYSMAAVFTVIAFSLGIYLAGVMNSAWNYLSYLFFIGILVYAVKTWRDKELTGIMTYGQAMKYATLFALFYSIAMAIWTYIFMSYIAPGLMESEMMKQETLMEAKGLPAEQVEMAMKYARMFSKPPVLAVMSLVGGMFFLTIINLIVAAIMKKDAPVNNDNQILPKEY
ncbi:hypothetical protein BH09BAC5_BH09BAC5_12720 [soil metagenome]